MTGSAQAASDKPHALRHRLHEKLRRLVQHESKLPKHLTQSIALEESSLPNVLHMGIMLIGATLTLFLLWAALTLVEEVASAVGEVIPSGHVQTVQHLEGGIAKEILVRDGDLVEKDQPLLKLDDTSTGADVGQIRAREKALALQAERLRRFTGNSVQRGELTEEENAILQSMEEAREGQRRVLQEQLAQKENLLQGLIGARFTLEQNVALMEKENEIKQTVAKKGYGSRLTALTSERELNGMKGRLQEASSQVQQAQDAIREAQSRLTSLKADLKQESMKNLGLVEAELAQVRKNLEKLEGTAGRTIITSPVRGVVKGFTIHTIGAVVESGKVLLEIVPVDSKIIVEAMVLPNDIGHLRPGQRVKVRVSAYEFSRYGSVPGTLENISATTFQTQDRHAFYRVRVKLDQTYVGNDPSRNLILPGMTVQADIVTGERSVLQYLLKPMYVASETAFREH